MSRLSPRPFVAAAMLVVVTGLTSPAGTSAAAVGSASQRAGTSVTAVPSAVTAVAGAPVDVTGKAPARHKVVLQRMWAQKWQTVARTTTTGRAYSMAFPTDWYGTNRARVKDVRTGQVSPVFTVTVSPQYQPAGSSQSWSYVMGDKWRWNPCQPITYRLNPAGGFAGMEESVRTAFAEVSRATGFTFRDKGLTDKKVVGGSWRGEDILLGWKSEAEYPPLRDDVMGFAMPSNAPGRYKKFSEIWRASVIFDRSELAAPGDIEGVYTQADADEFNAILFKPVILHEIVHAMGLGHVNDATQVMNPFMGENPETGLPTPGTLQAGDMAGLAALGAKNGCFPKPWTPDATR